MRVLLRRLAYLLRRRRAERELAEEMVLHRELAQRHLERLGAPGDEAARVAGWAMGNALRAREDARAVWIAPWLDGLWQDVRQGSGAFDAAPAS